MVLMSERQPDRVAAQPARKLAYIDALRGYAVLLVIMSHAGNAFPLLPYPVARLMDFGWNGVQLFFLLSCVTLLMSWRADRANGRADIRRFWLRRLFRIAPMYYLAGAYYFWTEPPAHGFDAAQLLATLTFTNAWHPLLIPTVAGRWLVVPGGWSIGVEVTFYALFPLIAGWTRSLRRACVLTAASLAAGCAANVVMAHHLAPLYSRVAVENFLYYWYPNQMPVFALGTVLFFLLERPAAPIGLRGARRGDLLALGCVLAGVAATRLPFSARLPFAIPLYLVASVIFMALIVVLKACPGSRFINGPVCRLGEVSFSAYLLHFSVLHSLVWVAPHVFDVSASGWPAIARCCALLVVTVCMTFAASQVTFGLIERPMIGVGRRLAAALP